MQNFLYLNKLRFSTRKMRHLLKRSPNSSFGGKNEYKNLVLFSAMLGSGLSVTSGEKCTLSQALAQQGQRCHIRGFSRNVFG